jgi:hypothetical protein
LKRFIITSKSEYSCSLAKVYSVDAESKEDAIRLFHEDKEKYLVDVDQIDEKQTEDKEVDLVKEEEIPKNLFNY